MERWSIYIDIEGFSALYGQENQVLQALGVLAEGILFIGRECYPKTPDRLFAHQTGDGFIIVSKFGAENLIDRWLFQWRYCGTSQRLGGSQRPQFPKASSLMCAGVIHLPFVMLLATTGILDSETE